MSFRTKTPKLGLVGLIVVGFALSLVWAMSAQAQTATYSLTGNTRGQIGNGLPLPVTFQPAPNGKVIINGTVKQTTGADPKKMIFAAGNLNFPAQPSTAFVAKANPNVFQVRTSLTFTGPNGGAATFSAGGRSGIPTFTWCPGQLATLNGGVNPSCVNPTLSAGAEPTASIRYEAGAAQFGGVSQPGVSGGANVALRGGGSYAPCAAQTLGGTDINCNAAFSQVNPSPVGVVGGPLTPGNVQSAFPVPAAGNIRPINVSIFGAITAIGSLGQALGTFPANNVVADYGAPWTTGKVTIKAPTAAETFYLQGSDMRVNGIGTISLVAGGVSNRSLSLDNANRGWQNFVVAPFSAPSISNGGLMLLAGIFLASTIWMVRRAVATN